MRRAASERILAGRVDRMAAGMRRAAANIPVAAVAVLLTMAAVVASSAGTAQAVGYQPDPPAGWTIVPLTEPAWAHILQVNDGVVAVSTRPADPWAVDAWFDFYRLADDPRATTPAQPATTVLRNYLRGQVLIVDSGLVVHSSVRPGTHYADGIFDVYVRDLGSGAVIKLPASAPNIPEIVADAGRIVWSQWGFQHEPEIMLYDMATGTPQRLSDGADAYRHPDIDGDDVVWQAWNGVEHRILHHDLATGVTRELAGGIPWMAELQPYVENGRVMWVQHEWLDAAHTQWEEVLYLLDLDTGAKEKVLSTGLPIASVQAVLDEDLLVTSVRQGDTPHDLVVRDLAAGTTRVLDDALEPPLSFSADDGIVAWEDVTAHISGGAETYDNRIMVYNAATGTTTQIAEGQGLWQPRVDNGRVVFSEWLDPENSKLWLAVPDAVPAHDHYLDVPATSPYHDAILDFSARGFVSGYLTGTFRTFHPAYPLLRAQLGKILSTSLGLAVNEELSLPIPFRDLGLDDPDDLYPHEYVAAVTTAGLMQGYRPDAFGPWDRVTRAQMVTVVMRAIESRAPHTLRTPPMGYVGTVHGAPTVHSTNLLIAEYNGLLEDLEGFGPAWNPNDFARRGEVVQMLSAVRGAIE
jgi:hypothetical protein